MTALSDALTSLDSATTSLRNVRAVLRADAQIALNAIAAYNNYLSVFEAARVDYLTKKAALSNFINSGVFNPIIALVTGSQFQDAVAARIAFDNAFVHSANLFAAIGAALVPITTDEANLAAAQATYDAAAQSVLDSSNAAGETLANQIIDINNRLVSSHVTTPGTPFLWNDPVVNALLGLPN